MVSPNLSPENSPHPSPRLPRHRHEPVDILPDNDDIPPKLPARTKNRPRGEDMLNNQTDATAHSVEHEGTRGRFPYAGVDVAGHKRAVPTENSATKGTTYAELAFPQQDKNKEVIYSHPPIGPRLSLNDKEITEFDEKPKGTAFDEINTNFDFVHEDPFEGANPFLNEKAQQQLSSSFPKEDASSSLPPRPAPRNLTETSKSLENLSLDNANGDYSDSENGYTYPSGIGPRPVPRCFSNPTYVSNFAFGSSAKPGLSKTYPPPHNPPGSDGEQQMEFNEEDFQVLMTQGYNREEIKKALITADNNFAMARKILRTYHGPRPHQEE